MDQQLIKKSRAQSGANTLPPAMAVHHTIRGMMILLLSGLLAVSASAQDKNEQYKGMYAGYGAKYVVAINDEIRMYMGITQGQQKVENRYFEYKSIL